MESANDLPLEETRLWLADYAQRRFTPIPAELIAGHIIAVTVGADFPVRRAAIEALHRRMQNIEPDGLSVKQSPEKRTLGQYTIAKPTNGNSAVRKRRATTLSNTAPRRDASSRAMQLSRLSQRRSRSLQTSTVTGR